METPISARTVDELDAAVCTLVANLNAETHRMLTLVREFDDRMGFHKWSFRSCPEWLAWRCGISLSAAREQVRTAQALRSLPLIGRAFAEGRLSYSKVRALTRVVEWHDEEVLLEYALRSTAAQVEERCRQLRNGQPDSAAIAQRAWERRALTIFRDAARGVMRVSVEVPIEEGEVIAQALDRAVAAGEAATGVEFDASAAWRAQQADALVAVAKQYLEGGETQSSSTADRYQVVVHVDESALRGGIGRADLPIETVKRLTCDGSLVTITEDEDGTPLDVGRKQRTVSTPLKRALWARDRGCTFPGCDHKHYVDGHHLQHWLDGGTTSAENTTRALHASPSSPARGRVQGSARRGGAALFPAARRTRDPAVRVSSGRHARRLRALRGGAGSARHIPGEQAGTLGCLSVQVPMTCGTFA